MFHSLHNFRRRSDASVTSLISFQKNNEIITLGRIDADCRRIAVVRLRSTLVYASWDVLIDSCLISSSLGVFSITCNASILIIICIITPIDRWRHYHCAITIICFSSSPLSRVTPMGAKLDLPSSSIFSSLALLAPVRGNYPRIEARDDSQGMDSD